MVLAGSLVSIGGMTLDAFGELVGVNLGTEKRQDIDARVRRAAYHIIEGKKATYYGIGSALARICEVVLQDERAILTVCAPTPDVEGVKNVTLALPRLVGGAGVITPLKLTLSSEEHAALANSASIIRRAIDEVEAAT